MHIINGGNISLVIKEPACRILLNELYYVGVCIPQGTVLIKNAAELMDFSKGEENLMEAQVKAIAATGANVIVTGGKVADMALHYANKYQLMVVR